MRDFMTRGGAVSVRHLDELHAAADDLGRAPAEAAEGGPAVQTHAGSGEARNAAHGAARGLCAHIAMSDEAADALMLAARVYVHALWDGAVALAAGDGPVPDHLVKPRVPEERRP